MSLRHVLESQCHHGRLLATKQRKEQLLVHGVVSVCLLREVGLRHSQGEVLSAQPSRLVDPLAEQLLGGVKPGLTATEFVDAFGAGRQVWGRVEGERCEQCRDMDGRDSAARAWRVSNVNRGVTWTGKGVEGEQCEQGSSMDGQENGG